MQYASFRQRLSLKIFVLLAYISLFFFLIPVGWQLFWLIIGIFCGVAFLLVDERVGFRWYQENSAAEPHFLVSRSPLFLISLPPLALLVFTSFGSFWAIGLLGGMMLWLILEMTELRRQPVAFGQRFWQSKSFQFSVQNIQTIVIGSLIFFALLHLLALA